MSIANKMLPTGHIKKWHRIFILRASGKNRNAQKNNIFNGPIS